MITVSLRPTHPPIQPNECLDHSTATRFERLDLWWCSLVGARALPSTLLGGRALSLPSLRASTLSKAAAVCLLAWQSSTVCYLVWPDESNDTINIERTTSCQCRKKEIEWCQLSRDGICMGCTLFPLFPAVNDTVLPHQMSLNIFSSGVRLFYYFIN